jgi:hypothetical protein
MPLGNPFDFGPADQTAEGFAGQSPGFWRDLASFGGNLAAGANQRTASGHLANGADFAGALGAGINATMQQGRENAIARAGLARSNAATAGQVLQNQFYPEVTRAQIDQSKALTAGQVLTNQWMPAINTANLAQSGAQTEGLRLGNREKAIGMPLLEAKTAALLPEWQSMIPGAVHQLESGGRLQPGIVGDGGAANGPMQVHQGALDDVNRATGNNYTLDQVRADPLLGKRVGDTYLQMQAQRFGRPDYALGAYNAGPTAMQNAIATGQGVAGLPPSAQQYVQRGLSMLQQGGGQPQGQQPQEAGRLPTPQEALAMAGQLESHSDQLLQAQNTAKFWQGQGFPATPGSRGYAPPGDPAAIRQRAQQLRSFALAGPEAAAKASAEGQVKPQIDRYGNMYVLGPDNQPKFIGRGSEVKEVFNPKTGNYEWGDVGGIGVGAPGAAGVGAPHGAGGGGEGVVAKPGPGNLEYAKGAADVQKNAIEHDNKIVDEDLSHMLETVLPAKQALYQLRDHVDGADTGAMGDFRATIKNYAQTFFPSVADSLGMDASPAQIFKKLALISAGKQERGDLGARGGFRAIEMYSNANPNLEMQPNANKDMANALLVAHQAHEDYARGAADHFNKNFQEVQDKGTTRNYQSVKKYDTEYAGKFRPELYVSAIDALNGAPYQKWSKGLTAPQMQIVGGILQRVDPNASIDLQGQRVPVSAFKTVIGPSDIMGGQRGR